ncbi:MAG: hypothetical protein ACLGSH_11300 [Acidobacteriota bacterium]
MSVPLQPALSPHCDPAVVAILAQLQEQIAAQAKKIEADAQELAYARLKIQVLEERLRLRRIAKYGPSSALPPSCSSSKAAADFAFRCANTSPPSSPDSPTYPSNASPNSRPQHGRQRHTSENSSHPLVPKSTVYLAGRILSNHLAALEGPH